MEIGCIKELKVAEYRVGLTPDNVRDFVARQHRVMVETHAGDAPAFPIRNIRLLELLSYQLARDIWANSDMIIKVKEPLEPEYGQLREGQICIPTYILRQSNPDRGDAEKQMHWRCL